MKDREWSWMRWLVGSESRGKAGEKGEEGEETQTEGEGGVGDYIG